MQRKIKIIGLTLFFTLTLFSFVFSQESMTITTYYPSPYGSYNELTTTGNTYLATTSGKVGIGTASPQAKLDVNGTAKIANWADESLGTNGYARIGSLLLQWGRRGAGGTEGTFTVTFPVPFTAIYNMQCTTVRGPSWHNGADIFCQVVSLSTSNATLAFQFAGGDNWVDDAYWFAIGR